MAPPCYHKGPSLVSRRRIRQKKIADYDNDSVTMKRIIKQEFPRKIIIIIRVYSIV